MTEDLLADFLSRDAQRIWAACGAVRRSWDHEALQTLAARALDIRAATDGVDLGGALRHNSTHLAFALRKLAHVAEGRGCLCGLYPQDDLFDPVREAEEGRVAVTEESFDPDAGTGHCRCRCLACGQEFRVREETGYHYPWYVWQAEPAP